MGLIPGSGKSPGKGTGLPEKSHGQRSLEGYSLWGCKESDMSEGLRTHTHTHTIVLSVNINFF